MYKLILACLRIFFLADVYTAISGLTSIKRRACANIGAGTYGDNYVCGKREEMVALRHIISTVEKS